MSDLELAWSIGDGQAYHDKYRKGDVWVMPMPSRSFVNDRSVFVYYEVYNLERDEFAQTRFKVSYTIQQDVRAGSSVFGLLSAGFRKLMAKGKKPQVAVSYERVGRGWVAGGGQTDDRQTDRRQTDRQTTDDRQTDTNLSRSDPPSNAPRDEIGRGSPPHSDNTRDLPIGVGKYNII